MSRIKVTYVAMNDYGDKPIVTANSMEDLRRGLDRYYGAPEHAECLGFTPYQSELVEEYEGHFTYTTTMIFRGESVKDTDRIKVYCVDFFPLTKEETVSSTIQRPSTGNK